MRGCLGLLPRPYSFGPNSTSSDDATAMGAALGGDSARALVPLLLAGMHESIYDRAPPAFPRSLQSWAQPEPFRLPRQEFFIAGLTAKDCRCDLDLLPSEPTSDPEPEAA